MAFEGYEIPSEIQVPRTDLSVIEKFSAVYGETPGQYMLGSVVLVATWGEMIEEIGFGPGMIHGISNTEAEEIELFDLDDLIGQIRSQAAKRKLVSHELGFDAEPIDTVTFQVPWILHPRIRAACVYFDHEPKPLISAAAEIRDIILTGQSNGLVYTFSMDGVSWQDVELDTISEDPNELIRQAELDSDE